MTGVMSAIIDVESTGSNDAGIIQNVHRANIHARVTGTLKSTCITQLVLIGGIILVRTVPSQVFSCQHTHSLSLSTLIMSHETRVSHLLLTMVLIDKSNETQRVVSSSVVPRRGSLGSGPRSLSYPFPLAARHRHSNRLVLTSIARSIV